MFLSVLSASSSLPLLLCYFVHWIASILYYLYRTPSSYFGDITFIDILMNERITTCIPAIGPIVFGTSIVSNIIYPPYPRHHNNIIIKAIIGNAIVSFFYWNENILYCMMIHVLAGSFFYTSEWAFQNELRQLSTLTCIYYHLFLWIGSYLETIFFHPGLSSSSTIMMMTSFLKYCSWFFYLFNQVTRDKNMDAYRFQSILSLTAASFLAPIGIWENIMFYMGGNGGVEWIRRELHLFYLAYVAADTYHGLKYYPQYFSFLEGWIHHVVTGLVVLYLLYNQQLRPISLGMIVEVPTIILTSSRVFYPHLQWIQKYIFPSLFVLCRIIQLGIVTWDCYTSHEITLPIVILYILFSLLNGNWIIQRMLKSKN